MTNYTGTTGAGGPLVKSGRLVKRQPRSKELLALVDAAAARLDTAEGEIALAAATLARASQSFAAAAHEIEELRYMLTEYAA